MTLVIRIGVLLTFMCGAAFAQTGSRPKRLVPGAVVAIEVVKVVLRPLYGQDSVKRKVFTATESAGTWIVLAKPKLGPHKTAMGGIVEVRVKSADAQITLIHLQL